MNLMETNCFTIMIQHMPTKMIRCLILLFKGYQIVPEATGNALLRINLLDTNTKLAIYFKYTERFR